MAYIPLNTIKFPELDDTYYVPVKSVCQKTGDVDLDADDVGAIAAPSNPASGAFLVWNGTAWVAQTLTTWQGGSY